MKKYIKLAVFILIVPVLLLNACAVREPTPVPLVEIPVDPPPLPVPELIQVTPPSTTDPMLAFQPTQTPIVIVAQPTQPPPIFMVVEPTPTPIVIVVTATPNYVVILPETGADLSARQAFPFGPAAMILFGAVLVAFGLLNRRRRP
jgi:hypothetical protein